MKMTALADQYDEPLDPATVDFTTAPGRKCCKCLFARQRVSVCNKVETLARRAGMQLCDELPVIYVQAVRDERQLKIDGE